MISSGSGKQQGEKELSLFREVFLALSFLSRFAVERAIPLCFRPV
jgi:hypothetical protein